VRARGIVKLLLSVLLTATTMQITQDLMVSNLRLHFSTYSGVHNQIMFEADVADVE